MKLKYTELLKIIIKLKHLQLVNPKSLQKSIMKIFKGFF